VLRGVLFDFNGTLARLVSWGAPHQAVFARHGLPEAGDRWGDGWLVGPADGEAHEAQSATRESYRQWELDRLRRRARACGVPAARVDALVRDLDRETRATVMAAYGDAAGVLVELRRRGRTVGVCSNWSWDLEPALAQAGLAGLYDAAVSSAQAGMRKPDPRIYRLALARCGLRPEETLYVGDTWGCDVEGPRAVGMRAVHLCRPDRVAADRVAGLAPLRDGIWRVADLPAVLGVVAALSGPAGPVRSG
jgi:putative hydrolase of the HAD superfamily